jgi:hypothetical protein
MTKVTPMLYELKSMHASEPNAILEADMVKNRIEKAFDPNSQSVWITAEKIAEVIKVEPSHSNLTIIGRVCNQMGFIKKRTGRARFIAMPRSVVCNEF